MLLTNTTVDVEAVVEAIRRAPIDLGVPDIVEVRTLAVETARGQLNAATVMRVGFGEVGEVPGSQLHRAGPLSLITVSERASSVDSVDRFVGLMERWSQLTNTPTRVELQFPTMVYKESFGNPLTSRPCWVMRLHDRATQSHVTGPTGPFYEAASGFFAESLGAAAEQWLRDPQWNQMTSIGNDFSVIIRDRRVEIARVEVQRTPESLNGTVHLSLESGCTKRPDADVAIATLDLDGQACRRVYRQVADQVAFPLDLPIQRLDIFLLDPTDGTWFDRAFHNSYGRVALLAPPELHEPVYKRFREDLARGESETVEFKAFIDVSRRDKKTPELLRVISAFANTHGGSLYIGVTDNTDVVGVVRELLKQEHAQEGNAEERRRSYASLIRRVIGEGISPTPDVALEWINHAELYVLRIGVPAGSVAHIVVEENQYYHRRGASCKKGLSEQFQVRANRTDNRTVSSLMGRFYDDRTD